jgi:hypothetical protein
MKFNLTNISSMITIISFIILAITLPKEELNTITNGFLFPFTEKLHLDMNTSRIYHWMTMMFTAFIYIIFIAGTIRLFLKKEKTVYSEIFCQNEIAAMLDTVDSGSVTTVNEKIITFLNEFDKNTANIFGLKNEELKSLWVFQIEGDEDNNYLIIDLNEKSVPSEEDKRIIKWALGQPNPQFWDDRIKKNFQGANEEFVFVRNYGEFRLGYALLFTKKEMITDQRLNQFHTASSFLMLLGKIDNLTEKMVKYIKEKEGL